MITQLSCILYRITTLCLHLKLACKGKHDDAFFTLCIFIWNLTTFSNANIM